MAEPYAPPDGSNVGLDFDGEYFAPFGNQVALAMPPPPYEPPRGDVVSLDFDGEYTPPQGDQVDLPLGDAGGTEGTFSITALATFSFAGDAPPASVGGASARPTITLIGQTPAASTGNISAGAQITLNGFTVTSGSGSISTGSNVAGNALVQRLGTFDISHPANLNLIGDAPVLPNLPTVWVYVCADPEIKIYQNNVYDPCAVEDELVSSYLTSPLYPVQIIDDLQAKQGRIRKITVTQPPLDLLQASGQVMTIELVDRVAYLEYFDWPPEELQANGQVTTIELVDRVIYSEYSGEPESLQANGQVTAIELVDRVTYVEYTNWPTESLKAGGQVTSIQLQEQT